MSPSGQPRDHGDLNDGSATTSSSTSASPSVSSPCATATATARSTGNHSINRTSSNGATAAYWQARFDDESGRFCLSDSQIEQQDLQDQQQNQQNLQKSLSQQQEEDDERAKMRARAGRSNSHSTSRSNSRTRTTHRQQDRRNTYAARPRSRSFRRFQASSTATNNSQSTSQAQAESQSQNQIDTQSTTGTAVTGTTSNRAQARRDKEQASASSIGTGSGHESLSSCRGSNRSRRRASLSRTNTSETVGTTNTADTADSMPSLQAFTSTQTHGTCFTCDTQQHSNRATTPPPPTTTTTTTTAAAQGNAVDTLPQEKRDLINDSHSRIHQLANLQDQDQEQGQHQEEGDNRQEDNQQQQQDDSEEPRPGAWSVPGPGTSVERRESTALSVTSELTWEAPSITSSVHNSNHPFHASGGINTSHRNNSSNELRRYPSQAEVLAVAAVVVDEDVIEQERETLTRKQQQLREQEARLAEQAAKLKAWEEELKRKQEQLEGNNSGHVPTPPQHQQQPTSTSQAQAQQYSGAAASATSMHHDASSSYQNDETNVTSSSRRAARGGRAAMPRQRSWRMFAAAQRSRTPPPALPRRSSTFHEDGSGAFSRRLSLGSTGSASIGVPRRQSIGQDSSLRPSRLARASSCDGGAGATTDSTHQTITASSLGYNSSYHSSFQNSFYSSGHESGRVSLADDQTEQEQQRQQMEIVDAEVLRASQLLNPDLMNCIVVDLPNTPPPDVAADAAAAQAAGPPSTEDILYQELLELLGEGPMRFAPSLNQPSLEDQLFALSNKQITAFHTLRQKWEDRQDKLVAKYGWGSHRVSGRGKSKNIMELPPEWHLRYLHLYKFNKDKAWHAEKKLSKRYVTLNVHSLRQQLQTKTLFPIPQLKTKDGHGMFYMRPCRFVPYKTTTKTIINNLTYVMNTMLENNAFACENGVGFMACMDDWTMSHFEINYCFQFMMALQGFMIPVKVQLFLIVNPPSWFGVIWKIMKPMLAPSFRKRVKMIPESKVSKYLMDVPDLEKYLPDDMQTGKADTDAMVEDFISYRQYVEQNLAASSTGDGHSDGRSVASSSHHPSHRDSDSRSSIGLNWHSVCESDSAGQSHSLHSSNSGLSLGDDDDDDDDKNGDDDDDEASIHCDISDEEHDDVKQSAVDLDPNSSEMMNMSRLYENAWR